MFHVNCPACGQATAAEAGRCAHCGAPFQPPPAMPPKKSNKGLIIAVVVCCGLGLCVISVIIAAIAIPGISRAEIAANERAASASLKSMVNAEENFRINDLDRNAVADYWTANVAGLYCMRVNATGNAVAAMSDIGVASADLDARNADAVAYSEPDASYDAALLLAHAPKAGYVYQALRNDEKGVAYPDDTDGTGRKVHSITGFGFAALPAVWDSTGNHVFIVNADASIFRRDFGPSTASVSGGAPVTTFDGSAPLDFPSAADLSALWGKVE